MSSFPEPDGYDKNKIKIKLHLSDHLTESNIKKEVGIDTPELV